MTAVRWNRVCKSFAGTAGERAVDDLSLSVAEGELLVIVGPSGCGKTTTLRLLAGLEKPDSGDVWLDQQDVTSLPPWERRLAMVADHAGLWPHLSVADNLTIGRQLRNGKAGWTGWLDFMLRPADAHAKRLQRDKLRLQAKDVAEQLGIAELLQRRPHQLSAGQRQRVALGRALLSEAQVWLLDEPFAHLDERWRQQLQSDLLQIQSKSGVTMILVTHDQREAMALGSRIAVMEAGRIRQIGTAQQLYEHPKNAFTAGFFGAPPMNLLAGTVKRSDGQTVFESPTLRLPISPPEGVLGPATLGIRAEHLSLVDAALAGEDAIKGQVAMVEHRGPDSLVSVRVGSDSTWAVRLPVTALPPRRGEAVAVRVAKDRVHLFAASQPAAEKVS